MARGRGFLGPGAGERLVAVAREAAPRGARSEERNKSRRRKADGTRKKRNAASPEESLGKRVAVDPRTLEPIFIKEKEEEPPWKEGEPMSVEFKNVTWTPAIAGAGEQGRYSTKPVLEDVCWKLEGPERVGLIGPNGCGKSTQLLMIQDIVSPTLGEVKKRPDHMKMAFMQQEAHFEESRSVYDELRSVFEDRSLESIDADLEACATDVEAMDKMQDLLDERATVEAHLARIDVLIPELGLSKRRNQFMLDLSGGWQMRVALGKIILGDPDLILLDEPTNHIDLETVEFMENFLRGKEVAMVIVSHDRYFLNQVCTKIVETRDGYTQSYRGNYVTYLQKRDTALAAAWSRYQRFRDRVAQMEKQIRKLQERFITQKAAQKREELQAFLAKPVPQPQVNDLRDFRFPFNSGEKCDEPKPKAAAKAYADDEDFWNDEAEDVEQDDMQPFLSVDDLHVSFGEERVLNGVSFKVKPGEKVAVVGANGCGKSTMVRAIVGDIGDDATVRGYVYHTDDGVAYFPQRLAEELNNMRSSVKDALYLSCEVADIDNAGGLEAVLKRLRLNGVTAEQPVNTLSGGEKARVAFAHFLLRPCALLVLDEPTNHLDIPTRELLEDALKQYEGAALVVSHDRFFLREFATRVVEVDSEGHLIDHDGWEAYAAAAPPQWQAAEVAEEDFLMQDAQAATIWSRKKLSRVKKRFGNVGLRRLSSRVDEFIPQLPSRPSPHHKEEKIVANLLEQGVDRSLLGVHARMLDGDDKERDELDDEDLDLDDLDFVEDDEDLDGLDNRGDGAERAAIGQNKVENEAKRTAIGQKKVEADGGAMLK